MSKVKREIAILAVVVVFVAVGLALYVGFSSVKGPANSVTQTGETSTLQSIEQNDFGIQGPIPLLTLTPQNETFVLEYNATTLSSAVALTFNQSQSYATVYTNGTGWVSFSQPCSSSEITSSSGQSVTSGASVVTVSGIPCGQPPNSGWTPVNGTVVTPRMTFNTNEIQVSLQPASFGADQNGSLHVTVTLNLRPGVYAIRLAFGVQMGTTFEISSPSSFPVIVT